MYIEAFTALQSKMLELGLTVDLKIFRVDFETASHKATKEVFPRNRNGMLFFFYFGQANLRNAVNLGFRQRYIEDIDFALNVRMVDSSLVYARR